MTPMSPIEQRIRTMKEDMLESWAQHVHKGYGPYLVCGQDLDCLEPVWPNVFTVEIERSKKMDLEGKAMQFIARSPTNRNLLLLYCVPIHVLCKKVTVHLRPRS
jgi:hypothetical protein